MRVWLMGLCMLFAGCSAMQKQKSQEQSASEVNTKVNSLLTVDEIASKKQMIQDSSTSDFLIQITPKGMFSMNADQGFKGEAEQVFIKGKLQQKRKLEMQEKNTLQVKDSTLYDKRLKTHQESRSVQRKSFWTGSWWWWYLLACAIGILVIYGYINRLRRRTG